MDLEIKEINNKEVWEGFMISCEEKTFLQSWNWGEFQKMLGDKIWRFGVFEADQLIAGALVVKIKAKRGTFLFVPHGPLLRSSNGNPKSQAPNNKQIPNSKFQILNILLNKIKDLAREERATFIRIAPVWEESKENNEIFKNLGFREAPIHMHPELTWELDIASAEEEILRGMRKTTRYLIRQAEKNRDIEIIKSQKIEDIEEFNRLYQITVKRHHFAPFSLNYLKNELLAFSGDNQILTFLGKYKGEVVSSAMVIFYSGIAYYHQGASSQKYSNVPVSYLIQWEAIKEAKKRDCKTYNFWGITSINQKSKIKNQKLEIKKHPWAGLTLFKMGFGGYKKEYVKTQDLPLSVKYWLTYLIEKLRKIKRRL